ncbi:MAG: S49 family peptidase, partial [Sulfuricellaceae bacterium]
MPDENNWERQTLEKLALSALQEQRRARHWGIFFKLLTFVFLFLALFAIMGWIGRGEPPIAGKHTAQVELRGVIGPEGDASA